MKGPKTVPAKRPARAKKALATSGDVAGPVVKFTHKPDPNPDPYFVPEMPMDEVHATRMRHLQAMVDSGDPDNRAAGLLGLQRQKKIERSALSKLLVAEGAQARKARAELDARRRGAITANKDRAKLPTPEVLQRELNDKQANTGCSLTAAKQRLQSKYGCTRSAINAKLRILKAR
jgi:hypothetical protein